MAQQMLEQRSIVLSPPYHYKFTLFTPFAVQGDR